jgi:hypothetical protein
VSKPHRNLYLWCLNDTGLAMSSIMTVFSESTSFDETKAQGSVRSDLFGQGLSLLKSKSMTVACGV